MPISVFQSFHIHYALSPLPPFSQGVPAGPCQFTVALHRTLDMPKFAASHILNSNPVLKGPAEYSIPPGSGADPELDEEGQPIEDSEKPPLPTLATG